MSDTNSEEFVVTQRHVDLMRFFEKVHTLEDATEEFNVGYYTIRKDVADLVDRGYIRKLDWRENRKILFQTVWEQAELPAIQIKIGENFWTIAEILPVIFNSEKFPRHSRNLAGILAHLAIRSHYARTEELSRMPHPAEEECFDELMVIKQACQQLITIIDQLVVTPIWKDVTTGYEILGSPKLADILDYAADWENYYLLGDANSSATEQESG